MVITTIPVKKVITVDYYIFVEDTVFERSSETKNYKTQDDRLSERNTSTIKINHNSAIAKSDIHSGQYCGVGWIIPATSNDNGGSDLRIVDDGSGNTYFAIVMDTDGTTTLITE